MESYGLMETARNLLVGLHDLRRKRLSLLEVLEVLEVSASRLLVSLLQSEVLHTTEPMPLMPHMPMSDHTDNRWTSEQGRS